MMIVVIGVERFEKGVIKKVTIFLFDIDGTITDSRQKIDMEFQDFMLDMSRYNKIAFVTGSDHTKTIEQVGKMLFNSVEYSFNCSGNEIWSNGVLIEKQEWYPPQELLDYLKTVIELSKFCSKTGRHIELRNGTINFSIPGRNCNNSVRADYIAWDKKTNERMYIQNDLSERFDYLDIFVGGDTGLDIYPKGKGKEQVIKFLKEVATVADKTCYFGDQIFVGGNDYNIAMKCSHRYSVRNWRETYEILSFLKETSYID